jgi:hypothetical protein
VPTDPDIEIVDWGAYGQVTPEQQAQYAVRAYRRAMEEWPWMGVVNFWFFKRASDAERNQAMYYFRMVEPDFTPLPVYEAMREYAANLTPILYTGVHQEDHWALAYKGDWETIHDVAATLGAYQRTSTPDDTLHFAFEGAALELIPGPGAGQVEVSVDGDTPQRVSLDGQPVRLVRGWQQERHQVVLTAVADEVSIDALAVQQPWRPSFWLLLIVACLFLSVAWILFRTLR